MRNDPNRRGKTLGDTFFTILVFNGRDFVRGKVLEQLAQRLDPHLQYVGSEHDERFRQEVMPPG